MMNTKMALKERVLSVILSMFIVLSVVPMSVFADNGDTEGGTVENAAEITDAQGAVVQYVTFDEAIAALQDGDTLKLLANKSLPDNVHMTNTAGITLDLNGYSLSDYPLYVGDSDAHGKLTVIDSSKGSGAVALEVEEGSELIFKPDNSKTTITQLNVYSSDVKLYGGRIAKNETGIGVSLHNDVKLTDLLPDGYAYKYDTTDKTAAKISYADAQENNIANGNVYDLIIGECDHELTQDFADTICPYCNIEFQAKIAVTKNDTTTVNGYAYLQEAVTSDRVKRSKNNGAPCVVTLLKDLDLGSSVLTLENGDYTLDLGGHTIKGSGANYLVKTGSYVTNLKLTIQNGKLEYTGNRLSGVYFSTGGNRISINVTLNVDITGGVSHSGCAALKLVGGTYKKGKSGSSSLETTISNNLNSLLAEGMLFCDENGNVLDLSDKQSTGETVTVKACDPHEWQNGECIKCHKKCAHSFTNGKCTLCGADCTHPAEKVSEENDIYTCECGLKMAVKSVAGDVTAYYTNVKSALSNATDGSTVTVISESRQLSVALDTSIKANTAITLDLNGHSLDGYALKINKENSKLTVIDSGNGNGAVSIGVWSGGTLIFEPKNVNTTISSLQVYGGTVELKGGHIAAAKWELKNGVSLADMLPEGYAYRYYRGGGVYIDWVTFADAKNNSASRNFALVASKCEHTGIDSDNKCLYCNADLVAGVKSEDGKNVKGYTDFTAAVGALQNGDTLTMLQDVNLGESYVNITNKNNITIDLNGKTLSGNSEALMMFSSGSATVKNGNVLTDSTNALARSISTQSTDITLENLTVRTGGNSAAAEIKGGSLIVNGGTYQGLMVYNTCTSVKLNGGTFEKFTSSDNEFSISIESDSLGGDAVYTNVMELTGDGLTFVQKDAQNKVVNGAVKSLDQDVVIAAHTHNTDNEDNKCECGFVCNHSQNEREASYFQRAKCAVCGCEYGKKPIDTTAPTGEIKIKERTWWQSLLNTVSFGLFYKEDVTFTVTATDDSYEQAGFDETKNSVKVEYLVSKEAMTQEAVKAADFIEYKDAVGLANEQDYVVYVKLTDWAGNVAYASTDGFAIDKTAPVFEGYTDGQTVNACGSVTLTVTDDNLDTVTVDGKEVRLNNGSYTIEYDEFAHYGTEVENHIAFASDKAGHTTTVTFILHAHHECDVATEKCKNCGISAVLRLNYGENVLLYGSLNDAFLGIGKLFDEDGVTDFKLTLLADIPDVGYRSIGSFDLTVDLNGHTFGKTDDIFDLTTYIDIKTGKEYSSSMTITGEGAFNAGIGVCDECSLTVSENAGYINNIQIMPTSTLGVPENFKIVLKGGTYGKIDLTCKRSNTGKPAGNCAGVLAPCCMFEGYSYDDALKKVTLENVKVVECTGHTWKDGKCSKCNEPCTHDKMNVDGNCSICGMKIVAIDDIGRNYISLNEAFACVDDGGIVMAIEDLPQEQVVFGLDKHGEIVSKSVMLKLYGRSMTNNAGATLMVVDGELTVTNAREDYKNITITQNGTGEASAPAVAVNGGTVIFDGNLIAAGGTGENAVAAINGTLDFRGSVSLNGGLAVAGNAVLENGLTDGIFYAENTGDTDSFYRVALTCGDNKSNKYSNVKKLLKDGYAFAYCDKDGNLTDANGNTVSEPVFANGLRLSKDVKIVEHTKHTFVYEDGEYVCSCGEKHEQHNFEDGKCTECGCICNHPTEKVVEENGVYTCGDCKFQMAVKVENGGTATYFSQSYDSENSENTLYTALNSAENGSTVTLLMSGLNSCGAVDNRRTITLDLNTKTLVESQNSISVEDDAILIVIGEGGSTNEDNDDSAQAIAVKFGGRLDLSGWTKGELKTVRINNSTLIHSDRKDAKIGTLRLNANRMTYFLTGGQYGKIVSADGLVNRAGNLLSTGYAFKQENGSYVPYSQEITSSSYIENVTVVRCDHTKLPTDFRGEKCHYCNTELEAAVKTADNNNSGYTEFKNAWTAAQNSSGCILTLLSDVAQTGQSETISVDGSAFTIDAGNRKLGYNLDVASGKSITVNGGTLTGEVNFNGDGSFVGTTFTNKVNGNGTLTLTGCVLNNSFTANGTVTLNACSCSADVTVNNNGSLTVKGGSSMQGKITVKTGGTLDFQNGTTSNVTAESDSNVTVSGGHFDSITVNGQNLIDCLADGFAFANSNGEIEDGRTSELNNVNVVSHRAHDYNWNTDKHENFCDCGDVSETDSTAPIVKGIENDQIYYGDVSFTVTDDHDFMVKDGDNVLTPDNDGKYKITADNKSHNVTAGDVAGNSIAITVTVNKIYNVDLPDNIKGCRVEGEITAKYGLPYSFTVTIADGYSATNSYLVKANGETVTGNVDASGKIFSYTVAGDKVDDNLVITVDGVEDITAPDVKITIGTNKFEEFLNNITFGLFFKNTQRVIITASDKGSGLAKAEYLLSKTVFASKDDIADDEWTEIELKDGTAEFSIAQNNKGYVYVRVTDIDGNVNVINSDGVVVYTDSTADTEKITFNRLSANDVSFNVTLNDNTVKELRNGKNIIDADDYATDGGKITLKNSYLKTLDAGEYTITVAYNPLGTEYNPKDNSGSQAPSTTSVKLSVKKNTRTIKYSLSDKTYNGTPYGNLEFDKDTPKPDNMLIEYKNQGADDSTYSPNVPVNAGDYSIRLSVPEDDDYIRYESSDEFSIAKAKVTIVNVAVSDKVYDGNNVAEIIDKGYPSQNFDDGGLTVVKGKAIFEDKIVGNGKNVIFSEFALAGSAKDNYVLTSQPKSIKANITKKSLTIENLKVKDKQYDSKNIAQFDGTPTLNGVINNDSVELVNGVPTFDSVGVGNNIPISFTEFKLTGGDSKNYDLIQPAGIKANILAFITDGSEYEVNSNDWINTDFVVTAKKGYKLSFSNTADDIWTDALTVSDEIANGSLTFYVMNSETKAISSAVSENYKIDKTAPNGEIELNNRTAFQTVINKITFGLFFKNDVSVRATANDDASGVKSVMYFKSDKVLGEDEVKSVVDWKEGCDCDIKAVDSERFIIYVRIEDKAGNVCYIGSDGAEFDTVAPKIIGVENGKVYYTTKNVKIDDKNIDSITLNGQKADNVLTLSGNTDKNYVICAVDKAGNATEYKITMKPISSLADVIAKITTDNVKSSDKKTVETVESLLAGIDVKDATELEKREIQTVGEKCKALAERISEVTAEIVRLTDKVNAYDIDKVTSNDRAELGKTAEDIDVLLKGNNLTADERTAMESLLNKVKALLERIDNAKSAAENEKITDVENITKDNVTFDDKDNLKTAEKAIGDALSEFDGNYTDKERESLKDKLETAKAALSAIENAENAVEKINELPSVDDVKLGDKERVERVKEIVGKLTENEKTMVGKDLIERLNSLYEKIQKLAEKSDENADEKSPDTGETSNISMIIALLFISGGIMTGAKTVGKKKKQFAK